MFDRAAPLPTGGYLEQADGTAWMAFFAQNMLDMALELAIARPDLRRTRDQVLRARRPHRGTPPIASAARDALWDEEDGFFYDVLRVPGQWSTRLKVRSIVGLLPLCAVTMFRRDELARLPSFVERARWFNQNRQELLTNLRFLDRRRTADSRPRAASSLTETKPRDAICVTTL